VGSFRPRSGPAPGCYRDLAGQRFRARRRSWDSPCPFAVFIRPEGEDRLVGDSGPTCRFAPPTRREFHRRGTTPVRAGHEWPGRGSWASRPSSQPCRFIRRPRHGFSAQGRTRTHRPGLPWDSSSSLRYSPTRLRPPLLETRPPGLLGSATQDVAAAMNVPRGGHALRRCTRGRRLADPDGVSTRAGIPV